eukprot:1053704-Rhodomonas_salina.1
MHSTRMRETAELTNARLRRLAASTFSSSVIPRPSSCTSTADEIEHGGRERLCMHFGGRGKCTCVTAEFQRCLFWSARSLPLNQSLIPATGYNRVGVLVARCGSILACPKHGEEGKTEGLTQGVTKRTLDAVGFAHCPVST